MKNSFATTGIRLAVALLPFAAISATIEWDEPRYVAGDTDVCTNGATLYAYCGAKLSRDVLRVNGVEFNVHTYIENSHLGDDIDYEGFHFNSTQDLTAGIDVSDTFSQDYKWLLSCSQYAVSSRSPLRVTLKNLTPGRKYLVQLWSAATVVADFANQTFTLDGTAVILQNPNDATRMGQYVTGTFIADAETQKFTAAHSKYAIINAIQVRDISSTPAISWEVHDAAGDSDVLADGRLLFAYTQCGEDVTLNGVQFKGVSTGKGLPAEGWLADLGTSWFLYANTTAFATAAFLSSDALSEGYKKLISGGAYGSTNQGDGKGSLTLRNLKPGRAYLVQIWISDARSSGSSRSVTLDGQCEVKYRSGLCGQYATGRFRATSYDQVISFAAVDGNGGGGSVQWNAIQLREIPTEVEWGPVEAIDADGACVSTAGDLVYAYTYAPSSVTVNGVEFSPGGTDKTWMGDGIELKSFNGSVTTTGTDFMTNAVEAGLSQAMHDLLKSAAYSAYVRTTAMQLKGLVPGGRYQVQILVGDNRSSTPVRYIVVDGSAHLPLATNEEFPYGATVKGEFTAKASTHDVSLLAMAAEGNNTTLSCQLQAVQLRLLSLPVAETEYEYWTATSVASANDVNTSGTLLYAYGRNGAKVNGVTFTSVANSASWPSEDVVLVNFGSQNATAFGQNISDSLGTDYKTLLSGGFYGSQTSGTITLKKLTVGHRYLFQMWIVDSRTSSASPHRYATVGGVTIPFRGDAGCGTYAICEFAATATTKAIEINFGSTSGSASTQFNALQVRDLGEPGTTVADGSTVSGTFTGTSFVKKGPNSITLSAAAPNLTHVLLNAGTLTIANPELVANSLDVTVAAGATLSVPSGKTLVLDGLSGAGTIAADGATLVLTNAVNGMFAGTITGDATLRKSGAWPYGIAGDSTGALSLYSEDGMFRLFNADRTGSLSLTLGFNAKLELDYVGTNLVEQLKYGKRYGHGVLSSDTLPGTIYGVGALEVPHVGTKIFVR